MYRVAIEESQAEPFTTPVETEKAHLALIERTRAAMGMAGESGAAESAAAEGGPAATLAGLRDDIAEFEARLVATGARLPDSSNRRALAQSMLDFWALQQSDLAAMAQRLVPAEQQSTMRPEPPTAKLLAPYDPATATDAAARAERCFSALPDDNAREAARRGFLALLQPDGTLGAAEIAALEPFAEARVLGRQPADHPGPGFGLVHEELPRSWSRLAEWQDEDARLRSELERLRSNAEAWSKDKGSIELPRGESLTKATELADQDETLLAYVKAAEEHHQRKRNILYGIIAVMGLLLIFLAYAGYKAYWPQASLEIAATEETAGQQIVVADTPQDDGKDTAAGSTGWIWLGSSALPQVVLADGTAADLANLSKGAQLRTRANLKIRNAMANAENIAGQRIGQVSGNVVIELQGPVDFVTVNGTDQYWARVRVIPVVYIQRAEGTALPLDPLRKALTKEGFAVQPVETVPNLGRSGTTLPFDVRYYYEQDAADARKTAALVARALGLSQPRTDEAMIPLVGSSLAERVKTGTIEVWIYAS